MDDLKKQQGTSSIYMYMYTSSFVHHFKSISEFNLELQSGNAQFDYILSCMTLKFDGWPWKTIGHLFYTTSSFVHHFKSVDEVKLELQSGNAQFGSKVLIFLSRVTLKFDEWPWKTIGHLFNTTLSVLHHFKAMGEFKLELQSGNAQFGSKLVIFCSMWLWNLTNDPEKR